MSLEAENAALKARVEELERERDHNASLVDEGDNLTMQESARADLLEAALKNCDLEIHSLRAQLEAAEKLQASTAEALVEAEENRRTWQKLSVQASERATKAEAQLEAAKADGDTWRRLAERLEHEKQSQLTAQPEGARVAELETEVLTTSQRAGDNVRRMELAEREAIRERDRLRAQLEAAKERCGEHACEKGHWRISYDGDNSDCPLCEAREEVLLLRSQTAQLTAQPDGGRSLDLATAWVQGYSAHQHDHERPHRQPSINPYEALAAPAPAKVCQTCGDTKLVHVPYVDPETGDDGGMEPYPCPDCAKESKP